MNDIVTSVGGRVEVLQISGYRRLQMGKVFSVTSLAVSLMIVVAGSGCKEEVPAPSAVGEPVAVEESAAESVAAEATKPARRDIVNTAKKLYSQFDEELC
ncbi:MAG TPA: hypothetical protein EYG16_01790, partial [Deltaproteobacteria bacterium]|nr:hypothetical protein [Deltaproteobacteria bacterium]